MVKCKMTYRGGLHCELQHEPSGATVFTDAPVDNHGKGEAFSPTDMVGAALGACAMTIIGIYAQAHNVDVSGMKMEVTKTMNADPRRIGKLEVTFIMPKRAYSDKEKVSIERAARTCPVHLSLHPDTEQVFTFLWQE